MPVLNDTPNLQFGLSGADAKYFSIDPQRWQRSESGRRNCAVVDQDEGNDWTSRPRAPIRLRSWPLTQTALYDKHGYRNASTCARRAGDTRGWRKNAIRVDD